ncbi:DGQHR domain-containing protein [Chryseobacterium cucumeris]|uniref:DGQHR domain-containing protein n=1 Tax=Chryseobacterium cucumeris TaxID=1813611 RepID=UPI00192E0DD9|nr:DGQHR domain-containing protein [Chryseobacterium cucumeris]QRA44467.1 DGQHR domain-containing protein [Chryseobacterium cucumeris]
MAFLNDDQIKEIEDNLLDDVSLLGKMYKVKNNDYQTIRVEYSKVDEFLREGWEIYGNPLKTKTTLRKKKTHEQKFKDDIWCQFYDLGYRCFNSSESFYLPYSKRNEDVKSFDIIAINNETILLIQCKSSDKFSTGKFSKDEFDNLSIHLDGIKKALWQIFGRDKKVKYIFATRNLRISSESEHLEKLEKTNSFYYNNNTYDYVNSLIKSYKHAAFYQFIGLIFKNELINNNKIEIPSVRGKMGKKDYYMFSIEPSFLLKMGFILHRTRANESEFPTYQRLLVPSRLAGITKFINNGGYFPNSIILNFNSKKHKIHFEANSRDINSSSCSGTLKIPNSYGIAYIIDGQHRVYGYANSEFRENNTIPVVAFVNMASMEQLEIFMDINENQKAVSPSLRLDLVEDLNWDSDRADSRLLALKSSITKKLANSERSPLFNKISVGEDKAVLTFKPFMSALNNSGLLPVAKGNKYNEDSLIGSLYDISADDYDKEMNNAKEKIVDFIISCYEFVEAEYYDIFNREKYFILSNRGTFAFISLLGSLNKFLTEKNIVSINSSKSERFEAIRKYLQALLEGINKISQEEEEKQMSLFGSGADIKWLRFFQSIINNNFPEYNPIELIDWNERQNEEYQSKGRAYIKDVERYMKVTVLDNLKELFGNNWELEINKIKTACQQRANDENEKNYKENIDKRVEWTEMFNINDYKTIIENYWTKVPANASGDFKSFEKHFAIDIGQGKNKKDVLKWISFFNSYRNQLAHEGSKEKGINKKEVEFLQDIHRHFFE